MAQLVNNHVRKLNELEDIINKDADNILEAINIDDLLKNPTEYLMALSDTFLKEHKKEIQKGSDEGKRFARKVLEDL